MADDPKPKRVSERAPAKRTAERDRGEPPPPRARGLPPAAELGNRATLAKLRQSKPSGGAPLDPGLRKDMERKFGADFAEVRIHADPVASELAADERARAFTVGRDIVFGKGELVPDTTAGRTLIAHELAHVQQQVLGKALGRASGTTATEADARRAAHAAVHGGRVEVAEAAGPVIQREELNFTPSTDTAGMRKRVAMVNDGGEVSGTLDGHVIIRGTADPATKCHAEVYGLEVTFYIDSFESNLAFTPDAASFTQSNAPGYHFSQRHRIQEGPYIPPLEEPVPAPPPKKKASPAPKQPSPAPKQPAPKQPEIEPAVFDPSRDKSETKNVDFPRQDSPASQMHQALLDQDLAKAAQLASQLGDGELAALSSEERALLLWGLGLYPTSDALDLDQVERIFNTTPDGQLQDLQRALSAGNGQLLNALKQHAKGPDLQRLGTDVSQLMLRSALLGEPDWSIGSAMQPRDFEIPQGPPIQWGGAPPDWASGLKVWTDDRGNWNFFDEKLGLTTIDMFGKSIMKHGGPADALLQRMQTDEQLAEELKWTGGKRYIEGRGLLDDPAWNAYREERKTAIGSETDRLLGNFGYGVQVWDETQHGWKRIPAEASHLFGGRSLDDPGKFLAEARARVAEGQHQIDIANTPTQLQAGEAKALGAVPGADRQLYEYKEDVYGGGATTIFVIKAGAVTATVVATGGYAIAAELPLFSFGATSLSVGTGGGMLFSAGRQGTQLLEGSRKDFSGLEVLAGGGAGAAMSVVPWLMVPASGYGMANSLNEAEKGHYGTFAFDMTAPVLGSYVTSPRFLKFAAPYALGAAMRGAGDAGLSPRFGTTSGGPDVVMVMPMENSGLVAPKFEIVVPGADIVPAPSSFINGSPSIVSPYKFPVIVNFAPPTATPATPQVNVPDSVRNLASNYGANPVTVNDVTPPVPTIGNVDRYWRLGKAGYLTPADLGPLISKDLLVTEHEHPHATAGVQQLDADWSKGASPAIRLFAPYSRIKTPTDNKLTEALKQNKISPEYWLQMSRTNIWRAWIAARAQGIPVPTASELATAILQQEAKMRAEGIIP